MEWKDTASGTVVSEALDDGKALDVKVKVLHDLVPEPLRADRFIASVIDAVLDRTPIDLHEEVRTRVGQEVPASDAEIVAPDVDSKE